MPFAISKSGFTALAILVCLAPLPAFSQGGGAANDLAICENGTAAAATRVAACTRVLMAGNLTSEQRSTALVDRAWSESLLHRMSDARTDYDKAIEVEPRSHVAYNERALFHLRLGEFDAAISDYDMALSFKPDAPFSLYGRGLTLLRKGDSVRGNDDIAAARRQKPDVDEVFEKIGLTP